MESAENTRVSSYLNSILTKNNCQSKYSPVLDLQDISLETIVENTRKRSRPMFDVSFDFQKCIAHQNEKRKPLAVLDHMEEVNEILDYEIAQIGDECFQTVDWDALSDLEEDDNDSRSYPGKVYEQNLPIEHQFCILKGLYAEELKTISIL